MKTSGGLSILLAGKPDAQVQCPPGADVLYIPRRTKRFNFSVLCIKDSQSVRRGAVLALDPSCFSVPLLSPCSGIVRITQMPGHILIERNAALDTEVDLAEFNFPHAPETSDSKGKIRYRLLRGGAWQFMSEAFSGKIPDPAGVPQAVIVSTLHLEQFTARGDVQIRSNLSSFTRGLEHLQSLLEYQPIYLVFPKITSEFALKVREVVRGYAWIRLVETSTKYPADDFALIARSVGLRSSLDKGPIWGLRTEGVMAVDRVITAADSMTTRIIAVGGPGVLRPTHIEVPIGYPLDKLREFCGITTDKRIVCGGALTGKQIDKEQLGVDAECDGLTVFAEPAQRDFLGFMRPGFTKRSFSRGFASAVFPRFAEKLTTALQGEPRPCISCGYCTDVCPAKIIPSAIHKLLYQNNLDEVEGFLPGRCIGCGLCAYVCPSKIELSSEIVRLRDMLGQEHSIEKGH